MKSFKITDDVPTWVSWLMLVLAVIFVLISLHIPTQTLGFNNEEITDFSDNWELLDANGKPTALPPIMLPTKIETDQAIQITKKLPSDLPYLQSIAFRSVHQRVKLYADGELIYSYGYTHKPAFGKSPGSAWNIVSLPENAGGISIVIHLDSPYSLYQGVTSSVALGNRSGLLFHLFSNHWFSLLITLVIFVAGVVALIVYYMVLHKDEMVGKEMLYLGFFAIVVSCWMFGESRLIQFFNIAPTVNTYFTLTAMLLIPIPLLLYLNWGRKGRARKVFNCSLWIIITIYVMSILLQVLNIADFMEQLPYVHICYGIVLTVVLGTLIYEYIQKPDKKQKLFLISLAAMAFFALLEGVYLYVRVSRIGNLMRIGVLIFIVLQAQNAFQSASRVMRLSRLANFDILTGCFNRTAYTQILMDLDVDKSVGIVIADVNDLKQINDTYGHAVGDDAIIRCARCFTEAFVSHGQCFRIGGDEFVMIGKHLVKEDMDSMCNAFQILMQAQNEQVEYQFSVSYGYAISDSNVDTHMSDTIDRADSEMYRSKRNYKIWKSRGKPW